ncbi:nuclear transport factor 2 family protein [Pseudonocardia kunmingensis]|uniref:SnoaL-like domain-containing protein n=1 Tax=Pseudonocardia kunmingensis TaxID=630975 RepID=A0A543DZA9_9PSEU|nr:nuclear transport factor 2 family protein [Pseudonocardia kunmingensis]TQM14579.1 hypothetical protein FB558_1345 [Pseudonocardia kunmingensis]
MGAPPAREVFAQALRCFLAKDMNAFADMFAVDGRHELPFAPPGVPARLQGREEIRAYLTSIVSTPLVLTGTGDLHVIEGSDPELVVVEYEARGIVTSTGKGYRMPYVQVLRAHDGEIALWRDYWSPLSGVQALGLRGTVRVAADRVGTALVGRLRAAGARSGPGARRLTTPGARAPHPRT